MVGAMQCLVAKPPHPISENQYEEKEEDARHLEKHDVPHSAERLEEPANASRHVAGGPSGGSPGHPPAGGSRNGIDRDRLPGSWPGAAGRRGLPALRKPLAGHSPNHANPDSQYPANGLRFHTRL